MRWTKLSVGPDQRRSTEQHVRSRPHAASSITTIILPRSEVYLWVMLASGRTQHDAEKAISMASSADASLNPGAHRAANGDGDGTEGTDSGGGDQAAGTNGAGGEDGLQFNEQTHYMNVKRIILVSH